jgi:hypothetical protein
MCPKREIYNVEAQVIPFLDPWLPLSIWWGNFSITKAPEVSTLLPVDSLCYNPIEYLGIQYSCQYYLAYANQDLLTSHCASARYEPAHVWE